MREGLDCLRLLLLDHHLGADGCGNLVCHVSCWMWHRGTPQGGSISVLLSNLYLHYVLDLWFERVVKGRLRGEAQLVRYIG